MDELYDDLENYDDVDTVNQLKTENYELKHKLEERNKCIEKLQEEFDKLAAEFKALEASYSSLLKSARAEIQRKTQMITNLNIEKDMLIITAAQKVPAKKIQKIVQNVQVEAKRKRKKKRNIVAEGANDRTEFIRRECERPPSSEASSTATDNSYKMMGNERLMDNTKPRDNNKNIRVTQENEAHKREVFPNHRGNGNRSPVAVDRRISALARHQFSKMSSDEEFEDLYSALKPKTDRDREPERNRKRGRDDSEDFKAFYNNTHDRPLNYPDPFRDRFNRNRTGKYCNNDRNMNKDKQYNEGNRNMNRDAQYDSNKSDKYDSHYRRYSPERHYRGAKEHPDDRYTQQHDRNRRLVSPSREKNQHRSRERRRSCHDRERQEHKQDAHRSNYPEPHTVRQHIHGEYDEPQNKRPRKDPPYPIHQEDQRLSEKQYSKEKSNANLRDHTCQSPDFSHEESSNEPIPEIRSTASMVLDDPRVTSKKYVISTEGNKEILQSANANKTYLLPVNKFLWNLQEVQVPNALKHRPSEIGEELVEEMEADKPLSIISLESGEVGSETTDTVTDDVSDFQEVHKSNYKYIPFVIKKHYRGQSPIKNTPQDIGYKSDPLEKHHKETSLIENLPKDSGYKSDILEKHRKEKSPTENTSKEIGYKSDPLENYHKEKSSVLNTSKHNLYTSNILENRHNEKSPSLNTYNDVGHERDAFEKQPKTRSKLLKSEKTNNRSADESRTSPPRDNNKVGANKHNEKPSILQRLINSVVEKSPDHSSFVKSSKSKEENERKESSEPRRMDKNVPETLKTVERKEDKKSSEPEKENETPVQIFRDFEHRVYSTRHIVEGDLELSDDSNDEKHLKIDEKKIDVKAKQRIRRKSTRETCKEKPVDMEDTTRKTRSKKDKKDKEDKTTDKFSELFGDSSSLITPEDLHLATRVAHALPAESCPTAPEDARDGIMESKETLQTLTSKALNSISEAKGNSDGSTLKEDKRKAKVKDGIIESKESVQMLTSKVLSSISESKGISHGSTIKEDKRKAKVTKDSKNRSHKRHKHLDSLSDDTHKTPDSKLNEVKKNTEIPSVTAVTLVLPKNETQKLMENGKITTDTNKNDAINPNEKTKGSVKINKRLKNKDEQRLSTSEPVEESNTKKNYALEANSNLTLASDNKENSRGNDNSEGNVSSEMARIFENTVSDVSKVDNDKLPLHDSLKDTISSTVVQDVPNLAPVLDEPGLVKTVVISTGIQLLDSNSTQYATAFNALASSTPAKELSIVNSSELETKISHSAQVSVTVERDDTVSQSENDAPDIRINYYRRRRKVLKR